MEQNGDIVIVYHDLDEFHSESDRTLHKFSESNKPREGGTAVLIKYGPLTVRAQLWSGEVLVLPKVLMNACDSFRLALSGAKHLWWRKNILHQQGLWKVSAA